MSLHPVSLHLSPLAPAPPQPEQTETQCLDNNWHSLVNCESRWSVVTCTSYILFEYTITTTGTVILLLRLSTGAGRLGDADWS